LLESVYCEGTTGTELSSIVCARPALDVKKSGPNAGFDEQYERAVLEKGWGKLLEEPEKLKSSDAYLYDVVDVGRQVLSNRGQLLQKEVASSFKAKDREAFRAGPGIKT